MKRFLPLLLLAGIVFGSGCSTSPSTGLSAWIGRNRTDLVKAYGRPTGALSNNLGQILVFDTHMRTIRMFWVDGSGRIYHCALETRDGDSMPKIRIPFSQSVATGEN